MNDWIFVVKGFYKCHSPEAFLSLLYDPLLDLKTAECEQVVLTIDIAIKKLYVDEQRCNEVQNEHNANNSRHAQFDTEEAIHRMQFSLHPEHESQEKVRDLNNTDYKQVSLNDLIVAHDVDSWHFDDQHVLNGLPDEVNRVVQEEAKQAVVGGEHKAKHEA